MDEMLKIEKCSNEIIYPYLISSTGRFVGGPESKKNNSRILRKNYQTIDDSPVHIKEIKNDVIKGSYLYAGPLFLHFGHIMTESIHRLYGARLDKYDGIVFSCASFSEAALSRIALPNFLIEILSFYNIPSEKCFLVKEPTIFEEVVYYRPGSNLQCGAEDWYFEYLNLQSDIINEDKVITNDYEKIFLGRSHIIDSGSVMGEGYINSLLLDNGFKYFSPELYNVKKQVQILNNAKEIVFIEGSSVYASELISDWGAKVMMIPRRNFDSYFKPHIDKKTNYSTVGDMSSVIRFGNHDNKIKPNSPSLFKKPESIINDLCNNKVIKPTDFNITSYQQHVLLDILRYSKNNKILANRLMHEVGYDF